MAVKIRCLIAMCAVLLCCFGSPGLSKGRHHGSSAKHKSAKTTIVVKRKSGSARHSHSILRSARGHSRHQLHVAKKAKDVRPQPAAAAEPTAENVQDGSGLAHTYHLYDLGVNDRLAGRFEQATKELLEASNTYSSTKKGLTLEAMIDYELGQSAEASNNYSVAADAYTRCLRIKPTHVEAAIRLASMLMKQGESLVALNCAREAVQVNPDDPRAHQILALVLEKNGFADDARVERDRANRLLKAPAVRPSEPDNNATPPSAPPANADDSNQSVPNEKSPTKPVDSDVMP